MKLFVRLAIATIAFLTIGFLQAGIEAPSALAAPPANDSLANAITVTTPTTPGIVATGNNTEATTESGAGEQTALTGCQPANNSISNGRTVWYRWTSPANTGSAALDTWGSNFDSTLAVFSGAGYPLTLQACNDDRFGGTRSAVSFNFLASTTYYIQLGAFGGGLGGDFVLNLSLGETMYVSNSLDIDVFDSGLALREAMNRAATGAVLTATEQAHVLNYNAANRLPGDLIHFYGGAWDINLTNNVPLPTLSGTNDHVSGIGATVEVDGNSAITNCFTLTGPRNQVSGMRIRRCASGVFVSGLTSTVGGDATTGERNVITEHPFYGVEIESTNAQGNKVLGNYIGTDGAGALGNGAGVVVEGGAGGTQIGGSSVLARNVIGFNSSGVVLTDAGTNNVVSGNYIGIQANGTGAAGNTYGLLVYSNGNTIGGESTDERNVISSNSSRGIDVTDGDNNNVFGNIIGLAPDGTTARPNGAGVRVGGSASGTQVGGPGEGEGNVIASNTSAGVLVDGFATSGNAIKGNYIGVASDGTTARPNNLGVWLMATTTNTQVGGTTGSSRNVIAGNTNEDVLIDGEAADGNTVSGNHIGLAADGETVVTKPIGAGAGVRIANGADNNAIGGAAAGAGNVISGYTTGTYSASVYISSMTATGNMVQGNLIGTDESGELDRGSLYGVHINNAGVHTVGGGNAGEGNLISGNGFGVLISGTSTGISVQGNQIGLASDGTSIIANSVGVAIHHTTGNTIGGDTAGERNVIGGSAAYGLHILGDAADFNSVLGNYIGVASDGVTAVANATGILIEGGPDDNQIGGLNPGEGNVISGNEGDGVHIQSGSTQNQVAGNFIGLVADGSTATGNLNGVHIDNGANFNFIGDSFDPAGRNVISGNLDNGVWISGGDDTIVHGNYIGTDASGGNAVPNDLGVFLSGASDQNSIGGNTSVVLGNVISGNTSVGVLMDHDSGTNLVKGNVIGLDGAGTAAIGNGIGGVALTGAFGALSDVGGTLPGDGNVISGNGGYGVFVNSSSNNVRGNFIGTSRDGMSAVPNVDGVVVGVQENGIGANVISGNSGWGIDFLAFGNGGTTIIDANWVGADASYFGALGNGAGGIRFRQHPVHNVVLSTSAPNTIAFNGGPGILVDGFTFDPGQGIQRQSIHGNAGLGIDLVNGGNGNEPPPIIGGILGSTVSGFACPGCTVDVYTDSDGEGRFYHTTATANGIGQWSANIVQVAEYITATSTDAGGNTSEFASFFAAEPCDGVDNDGDGLTDEGNPNADGTPPADCLDTDDDGDGLNDGDDSCDTAPEDADGVEDADGCPDYDNDSDGICDDHFDGAAILACSGEDRGSLCFDAAGTLSCAIVDCSNVAEDYDAFKDGDGCPEPDNDNDGFPDVTDDCPGTDARAGADGMLGSPQDLNHNGVQNGSEAALTTDDVMPQLVWEDQDGVLDTDGCHDSPGDDFDGDGLTDDAEVFTYLTDAGHPDTDSDTVSDGTDNCPNWANAAQNVPAWAIPAEDSDCDGWTKAREQHVGTDPTKHCNVSTTANDEPDAWPGDFNDNQITNLPDVISFGPTFNKLQGQPGYNQRYDLNVTNQVLLSDVILMGAFFNKVCG